jgi:hypothetical protein
MFTRMSHGWELAKESWQVLKLDKSLLVFPLISGVACLLVLASFAIPLWNSEFGQALLAERAAPENPVAYVVLFLFYFVNYFVVIFFNAALVSCAILRFKGGQPTVRDGLQLAWARLPQILGWALVSATVGLLLRIIESRSERVGQIVAGLMGMAWSATTYFVVPVIVVEKSGPITATKRSLSILRRTWGEALSANFGIGLIVFLVSLIGVVPLMLGVAAFAAGLWPLGILGVAAGVTWILLVSLVSSALNAIIVGALYLYAAEGSVPRLFNDQLLASAFTSK